MAEQTLSTRAGLLHPHPVAPSPALALVLNWSLLFLAIFPGVVLLALAGHCSKGTGS